MADKSTYWRNAIVNAMRGTGITAFTPYVSLHTADPGLTGTSEVVGGSYARQTVTWDAPTNGVTQNGGAAVTFTNMPSATITHAGIWDSATAGNFIYGDALTNGNQVVNAGGTFEFPINDLDLNES